MWEGGMQIATTVIGLITGVGTIVTWVALWAKRGNRVPSRQRPKGAWERVAALSSLTRISDDPYLETMASSAARVAAEAEAFVAVRRRVKLPLFMTGLYVGIGVLAFFPTFSFWTLVVGIVGAVIFLLMSIINALHNLRDKVGIHVLVGEGNELILRNPFEALQQYHRRQKSKQDVADRILGKGLRKAATKISGERARLKTREADLAERERAIEEREKMIASNWRFNRG